MTNPNQAPQTDPAAELRAQQESAYASINELIDAGQPLDGPVLNGAGLGYEQRIKLGYDGSIDQLLADAADWKAEKVEQERREAYHADNAQKAADWKAEKDSWREQREATDSRIDSLMDGSAAVEGMSYKQKLENGGELGLKQLVENAKMSREDAVAQAAAEGRDVSHAQPRAYEVPRNEAAESRAADMAALLKEQTYRVAPAPEGEAANAEPEAEVQPLIDYDFTVLRRPTEADEQTHEQSPADNDEDAGLDIVQDNHESVAADESGRWSRSRAGVTSVLSATKRRLQDLKDAALKGGLMARTTVIDKIAGKETSLVATEENYRSRQRAAWGVALGVVAIYAASRFGVEHSLDLGLVAAGDHDKTETGGAAGTSLFDRLEDSVDRMVDDAQNAVESDKGDSRGNTTADTVADKITLERGDTAWDEAEAALGKDASVQDVDRVKDAILQQNGLTEAEASSLPIGTRLEMPVELIEELNKKKD
ncbi:MAG TPA: hypothetical protein VGE30_00260 [Candidatus Saccharimonadales bacterium]